MSRCDGDALTGREREIVAHLAAGRSTGDVAALLGLAEPTVRSHIRAAMMKLGARSCAHAAVLVSTGPDGRAAPPRLEEGQRRLLASWPPARLSRRPLGPCTSHGARLTGGSSRPAGRSTHARTWRRSSFSTGDNVAQIDDVFPGQTAYGRGWRRCGGGVASAGRSLREGGGEVEAQTGKKLFAATAASPKNGPRRSGLPSAADRQLKTQDNEGEER